MLILILAVIVSFIPSILLFLFLRNNRKEDEQYRKDCLKLLGQGFLIALLIFLFDLIIKIPWNLIGIGKKYPMIDRLFTCFIVNATVEEISKFLVANNLIKNNSAKVSRLDIISFLTISAIGFGLVEDMIYVFTTNIGQIIVRGIQMGHVPYQLLMSMLYTKGIIDRDDKFRVLAFVAPILLHGTYNFLLTPDLPDWTIPIELLLVLAEFIYIIYMIFFIRKKRNDTSYTDPIFPEQEVSKEISE